MLSVYKRLAELRFKQRNQGLTAEEETEMRHCLDANMNRVRKLAGLENLSYAASVVGDIDWQHDICRQIDEFTDYSRM